MEVLGTYFVTGNHEEFRDNTHFLEPIKNIGIKVLNDQMVIIFRQLENLILPADSCVFSNRMWLAFWENAFSVVLC